MNDVIKGVLIAVIPAAILGIVHLFFKDRKSLIKKIKELKEEKAQDIIRTIERLESELKTSTMVSMELKVEMKTVRDLVAVIPKIMQDLNFLHQWKRNLEHSENGKEV